jgi:group I intron endonuclease
MKVFIYSLSHPITHEVRYVGKTVRPKARYNEHINDISSSHKANWIKLLLSQNLQPNMNILEECIETTWSEREKYWIKQYHNLTNSTEGGEDGRLSKSVRKRLSKINSGKGNPNYGKVVSQKTKDKLSDRLTGRKLSNEHKDNISKGSHKRSVIINGIQYISISDASRKLDISVTTIYDRINTNHITEYQYI